MTVRATSTITAVLVDDEQLAREELSYLLKEFPDVELLASGRNGLEAIKLIENFEPDVVFLDVQMPGLDGFGVIQKLRETDMSPAPFHPRHGLRPVRARSFPLGGARLSAEADRERPAGGGRGARPQSDRGKSEERAAGTRCLQPRTGVQRTKLLVKNSNRNFIVDAQDVIYATIEDGLITVVATGVEGESNYRTIEELQSNLDPDTFWRVHRSFLVNINRIREVIPWFKSSFQLRMDDKKQTEIPVSRVQTKRLRALLKL